MPIRQHRREFLRVVAAGAVGCAGLASAAESDRRSLKGVIGFTTGSLNHQRETGELTALTLPRFVREEMDMRMIDFNTNWLKSFDEDYVQQVRKTAAAAGCYFTNLKVNHDFGDLYGDDAGQRKSAMSNARRLVEVAHTLGARWIRFKVPKVSDADTRAKLAAHRELAAFAERHQVQLLVENLGWLQSDPRAIVRVVKAIGKNVAACPDTGNWDDAVRYEALAESFPGAASCDFKVFDLEAGGRHAKYDIERCFKIGWNAGFRGPWALEHWNKDTKAFAREMVYLRDKLKQWMAASEDR